MTGHIFIYDRHITVKHCYELHGADFDQSSAIPHGRQSSVTQDNEVLHAWNLRSQSMVGPVLKQAFWLLTLYHVDVVFLFVISPFFFYKDNKLGKCVSFHKCDTVQKACWKKNHIPECWSWKPPQPGPAQEKMRCKQQPSCICRGLKKESLLSALPTPHGALLVTWIGLEVSPSTSAV